VTDEENRFVSRFGPDPQAFFDSVYLDVPPWDVGGPQTAMAALLADFPPESPALDVGCGSGDLAIHLARLGLATTGIDFVESAILKARAKAAVLPPDLSRLLDFQVADALQPSLLQRQFGSVVDSGFYHLFDPAQSEAYAGELQSVLREGGRLYLHAFATEFPVPNMPRAVTEEELRGVFTEELGWRILAIRGVLFESRVADVPAIAACVQRTMVPSA
jgi:SAM-dependent methyltransferase